MLSPAEIASEIGRSLDFLATEVRDVPERRRSMRAALDHSWRLLSDRERDVFQSVSVFRGGFTRQAAGHVAGATLRELKALVDRSLLHRAATGRYEVHELLRQYAAEKLDEAPGAGEAARDRHSAYYVAALQQWAADLKGPRQGAALADMEAEVENARAAWSWAVEQGQVQRLDQAADGLFLFYEESLALRQSLGDRRGIALSLMILGAVAVFQGRLEEAERLQRKSYAIYRELDDRFGIVRAGRVLSVALTALGKLVEGCSLREESVAICSGLGSRARLAYETTALSWAWMLLGQYEEARAHAQASLTPARETGTPWVIADALGQQGWLALVEGAHVEAHDLIWECLAIYQDIGRRSYVHWALVSLGYAARGLGLLSQAGGYLSDGLRMAAEAGHFAPLVNGLGAMALLLADRGEHERAVEIYALACALKGTPYRSVWEDLAGRHIAVAAATLPPDVVAAAQARGRARDLQATVAELLAEFGEE